MLPVNRLLSQKGHTRFGVVEELLLAGHVIGYAVGKALPRFRAHMVAIGEDNAVHDVLKFRVGILPVNERTVVVTISGEISQRLTECRGHRPKGKKILPQMSQPTFSPGQISQQVLDVEILK